MTARQLVLVRHAKAGEGAVDRDRPLADRGIAEAPAVGRWLADRGILPDRVVVSPARRAATPVAQVMGWHRPLRRAR